MNSTPAKFFALIDSGDSTFRLIREHPRFYSALMNMEFFMMGKRHISDNIFFEAVWLEDESITLKIFYFIFSKEKFEKQL